MEGHARAVRLGWVQIQQNRNFQKRTTAFQHPDVKPVGARLQAQAQRCHAALRCAGCRPQTEKQGVALPGSKMDPVHGYRMGLIEPAQQGRTGVVLKYFFDCPKCIPCGVRPDPQDALWVGKPLPETGCRRHMRWIDQNDAARITELEQRRFQQLYFTHAWAGQHDFDQSPAGPALARQLGIQVRIAC